MENLHDDASAALNEYNRKITQQYYGIDISQIDLTPDYYDAKAQVAFLKKPFEDRYSPKQVSSKTIGIFSNINKIKKSNEVAQSRPNVGPDFGWQWSTNPQDLENFNIETVDKEAQKFRQGVEIQAPLHAVDGLTKISAGTPGHLFQNASYGVNDINIGGVDKYFEIDLFNPLHYIELQLSDKPLAELITFPIITSDANQLENYILNGIIEPFPIRPVIALFSINTPFEPHSIKGQFGNGNSNTRFASGQVMSLDYFNNSKKNESVFLDAVDIVGMANEENESVVNLGPSIGYYSIDENHLEPFLDAEKSREIALSKNHDANFMEAVKKLNPDSSTYVSSTQKCFSTGFIYDNIGSAGVDSIAFGGLTY